MGNFRDSVYRNLKPRTSIALDSFKMLKKYMFAIIVSFPWVDKESDESTVE